VSAGGLHFRPDEDRLGDAFGVTTLPAAFLVVEGQRVARFSSPHDWDSRAMRALVLKLLGPSR
jgi:thioredoxin-like negative regulator of GroEL